MATELDLGSLLGTDIQSNTDQILNSILLSMENFQNSTTVKGTGDIFNCAISLGDFDFDLNFDLFDMEPTKMDYILLKKIQYLRRLIVDINNIFINLIQDLECCTGDDRYNKTVVPIFKWLVEDEDGLCGSLLKISKDLNKIYLPLKRILCLFKVIPGNPTIGAAGTDIYKYIYPIIDGIEKVMNMLDNGRFLDLLIIPIKDFHDKLVACSNGKDVDFYTGNYSLKDIISDSVYTELTANLIDSIKSLQTETSYETSSEPTPPTPLTNKYGIDAPNIVDYDDYDSYSKALYTWNIGYTEFRKSQEREYDKAYSDYLLALEEYRQSKFEKTLQINDDSFENSSLAVQLVVDDFKTKHRAICGCLGEIFRLDGLFIPKDYVIRSESDYIGLIGEVKYLGVSVSNYYTNSDNKIDVINYQSLNELRSDEKGYSLTETMKYPFIREDLKQRIDATSTIDDVLNLNSAFQSEMTEIQLNYRKMSNYWDSVNSAFYSLYLKELAAMRNSLNQYKIDGDISESFIVARKKFYEYTEYPPSPWLSEDKSLSDEQQAIFGNITYLNMVKGIEDTSGTLDVINEYKEAIGRNFAVMQVVDNSTIECGCDLLCMIVKYIINLIMQIIKLLLSYITKYLASAIANKELMWWMKFIQSKIQCIIDIANLSKDIAEMEKKFDSAIKAAEGSIKKVPESLTSCTTTKSSVISELNLYYDKAHVAQDTLKDINWVETTYPEYTDDTIDATQKVVDTFNLTYKNITTKTNEWKNRSIPTLELDCSLDHSIIVDWVPSTSIWKMYLNVRINIDQFNNNPDITLDGDSSYMDSEIISDTNDTIVYNLMSLIVGKTDFWFKILYNTSEFEFKNDLSSKAKITTTVFTIGGNSYNLDEINSIYFWWNSKFYKVYDRNSSTTLAEYVKSTKKLINDTLISLQNNEIPKYEVEEQTNNKLCSATNLVVTQFEPVYNSLANYPNLYPGDTNCIKDDDNNIEYITITPRKIGEEFFTKNNVPYKITLMNGSGTEFIIILLIDICQPTNVINTSYDKTVDGVFLNGRYDYFEFTSIPNNSTFHLSAKEIIVKLKTYLENIGAITLSFVGASSIGSSTSNETISNLIKNVDDTDGIYSDDFDDTQDTSNATVNIGNLPDAIKSKIAEATAISSKYANSISDLNTLVDNIDSNINDINSIVSDKPSVLTKQVSKLGIPLCVLNESKNIVLTIHDKKLKLININNSFALNLPLETEEIDYKDGEQLFIEFSTTGFNHTISWTNERKVSSSASTMSTEPTTLKPTQIGSYYKDGHKLALLCGDILDIIFTEGNKNSTDWNNNSNTYRPSGTIGYYDFSVFDGYMVYSIPEFFKVTKLGNLATTKGILYESKEYTRAEIATKIQNNEINDLLTTEVIVVGDKPITVGGDFIWKNKNYYKNVTFAYLDNFFCRDNLSNSSFSISFWLKMKDAKTNNREDFDKKYIFSDTHNGNFIWLEDNALKIKFLHQPLRTEPVTLLFKENVNASEPVYVEKWFHHTFRYDKANAMVYYNIEAIDQKRNFDQNYDMDILSKVNIKIPIINSYIGKNIHFSLVSMLARYDVKQLVYTDLLFAEITALAIWNSYKDDNFMKTTYDYQKRIIINEMD